MFHLSMLAAKLMFSMIPEDKIFWEYANPNSYNVHEITCMEPYGSMNGTA